MAHIISWKRSQPSVLQPLTMNNGNTKTQHRVFFFFLPFLLNRIHASLKSCPTIHAISMNTGSISMLWKGGAPGSWLPTGTYTRCDTPVMPWWCQPLSVFSLTFVNQFWNFDVDYVLFTEQIALEISSCGVKNPEHEPSSPQPRLDLDSEHNDGTSDWPHLLELAWKTAAANFSPNCVFFFSISHYFFLYFLSLFGLFFSNKSKCSHHRSLSLWLLKGYKACEIFELWLWYTPFGAGGASPSEGHRGKSNCFAYKVYFKNGG